MTGTLDVWKQLSYLLTSMSTTAANIRNPRFRQRSCGLEGAATSAWCVCCSSFFPNGDSCMRFNPRKNIIAYDGDNYFA